MFIGHFAVAFAAKRAAPSVSLGTLFVAAQLADLVWPTLVLLGVEVVRIHPGITAMTPLEFVHYPWSHSLVALAAWAVLLAAAVAWRRGSEAPRVALVVGAVVLSHWVLDVVSHRPDMPLTLAGPARLGLGLWYSVPATLVVEITMFLLAVRSYASLTRAVDRVGRATFLSLIAFLLLVYLGSALGPPPPSTAAVAWSAEAIWLLVAWAWWIDRHRSPRSS